MAGPFDRAPAAPAASGPDRFREPTSLPSACFGAVSRLPEPSGAREARSRGRFALTEMEPGPFDADRSDA